MSHLKLRVERVMCSWKAIGSQFYTFTTSARSWARLTASRAAGNKVRYCSSIDASGDSMPALLPVQVAYESPVCLMSA